VRLQNLQSDDSQGYEDLYNYMRARTDAGKELFPEPTTEQKAKEVYHWMKLKTFQDNAKVEEQKMEIQVLREAMSSILTQQNAIMRNLKNGKVGDLTTNSQ
jgi:hypothetical protein